MHHLPPDALAEAYGRAMWSRRNAAVADEQKLRGDRFTVALATGGSGQNFHDLTKRATLISDTLLLSHTASDQFHTLAVQEDHTRSVMSEADKRDVRSAVNSTLDPMGNDGFGFFREELSRTVLHRQTWYGMYCPNRTCPAMRPRRSRATCAMAPTSARSTCARTSLIRASIT